MKRLVLTLTIFSSLLFLGYNCDGNKFNNKGETLTGVPAIDDKGIAFEVFQRIPKKDLDEKFQTKTYTCPEDCTRHFGDSEGNDTDAELYEYNGNWSFSVDCFPLKDGGWLALLVNEGCFDGCNHTVKTYVYKNGVLHFVSDKLPRPKMDEMIVDPFVICGVDADEIADYRSEWDSRYLYYVKGDDTLSVDVECLNYDEMIEMALCNKQYVWDGESFVEITPTQDHFFNIVDYKGLGSVKLGDAPPESITGFSKVVTDKGVLYSRNGQQVFKAELDDEGKIEAIEVYAKEYQSYQGKIGDILNELVKRPSFMPYYKGGTFVLTDENGYDNYRIDYVGPNDAIDGNFMEGLIAEPKFKPDAKVQCIRLYKFHDWVNDTCDMRALKEAMDAASLFDGLPDCGKPEYDKNDFRYFRELYNHDCDGWCDVFHYYLHCYPLKSGGFKVYATTEWQPGGEEDPNSGFSLIDAYIYKNGVLTKVEPEPELNDFPLGGDDLHFTTVSGIYFYDRTMTVATGFLENGNLNGVEFTWDGTAMKKTYEGVFDD